MTTVKEFLSTSYFLDSRCSVSLADALKRYRKSLPKGCSITRKAFVAAVSEHFPVGRDSSGIFAVGGLSVREPQRLEVVSGRLRLV